MFRILCLPPSLPGMGEREERTLVGPLERISPNRWGGFYSPVSMDGDQNDSEVCDCTVIRILQV